MAIPGARIAWVRDYDLQVLFFDVIKALAALAIAAVAVPRLRGQGSHNEAVATLLLAGTICISSVLGAIAAWRQKRDKQSLHDLEGCLHTLHAVLHAAGENSVSEPEPGVRVTIHVPKGKGDGIQLEQVCDYICRDPARVTGRGRLFSPHTGLIGEVYRTWNVGVVERTDDNYEAFLDAMTQRWGYTRQQAKALDASVMSYMAVPLVTPERGIEAIVYVDSCRRGFFTKARQELVEGACLGIALFVGRRYA